MPHGGKQSIERKGWMDGWMDGWLAGWLAGMKVSEMG